VEEEKHRIESDGGAVMEKGGIQRVVWKRPVVERGRSACRSTDVEQIPFLAISRALGTLCYIYIDDVRFDYKATLPCHLVSSIASLCVHSFSA